MTAPALPVCATLPALPDPGGPFVLLEDAGGGEEALARLYVNPVELVVARRPEEVAPALARLEQLAREGRWLAGHIAYEAGLALEPRLAALAEARCGADGPLLWFGAFARCARAPAASVPAWLAAQIDTARTTRLGPLVPALSPGGYAARFAAMAEAIHAGDIYQANFTLPLTGRWRGDPLAIYAALRPAARARHGGIVHDGQRWLLSLSPELFVETREGAITARPMKGTRPRGATPEADAALARDLAQSPKDRAENLMILDLMRNDLSRIAVPGSVRVAAPFTVETYPTVHQMVSDVQARLVPGLGIAGLLGALFPCGSITGAPKIRAMELIHAHERDPRGAYCGAIGRIDPPNSSTDMGKDAGEAAFNVAIRTLCLTGDARGGGAAQLGVGSGLVADSRCLPEWRECLVKGGFVHQPAPGQNVAQFDLIETMRFTPEGGIPLLERHLERLGASARALGFAFDRHAARNAIHALCFEAEAPSRLRLLLARSGAISLEIGPAPAPLPGPVPCIALPLPVEASDWRLAHKTSERTLYDDGLATAHAHDAREAILVRDDGLVTEGCFTSVFVERDGKLHTPPLAHGLLPGVLRAQLLADQRAVETPLTLDDLAKGFLIGNALRGLMPAILP